MRKKKDVKKFFSKVLQCVKLEKKINFDKLIWLYWKMKKIYKYFFGWFSSSWNEKKKRVKKKTLQVVGWAIAHLCFESRYSRLYRDTTGMGTQGIGHDTARARPRYC